MKTIAKRASKRLGRLCRGSRLQGALELTELFLQAVQGKRTFESLTDEVTAILPLLPRAHPIVVDAGAHRGGWTHALLRALGSSERSVYLIEPDPANLAVLETMKNGSCRILPYALSDREEDRSLFFSEGAPYLQSLFERRIDHESVEMSGTKTVSTITIDRLVEQEGLSRIDLLKMDIEGAELLALEGAERTIAAGKLRAVTFEVGACNVDARVFFKDFWYFFQARGFSMYRMMHGGWLHPIDRYRESLECFQKCNYVAVAPEMRVQ